MKQQGSIKSEDDQTEIYVGIWLRFRLPVLVASPSSLKLVSLKQGGQVIADLQIVKVGGGLFMPMALAQGVIDIGFGGVAPVFACVDSGAPVKLVSPLHYKGDMFVVRPDFPANSWQAFVEHTKGSSKPIHTHWI